MINYPLSSLVIMSMIYGLKTTPITSKDLNYYNLYVKSYINGIRDIFIHKNYKLYKGRFDKSRFPTPRIILMNRNGVSEYSHYNEVRNKSYASIEDIDSKHLRTQFYDILEDQIVDIVTRIYQD